MKHIILVVLLLGVKLSVAQELTGKVLDAKTGEGIPFANILITEVHIGTIADSVGNFTITGSLPDQMTLRISASFYETQLVEVASGEFVEIQLESSHQDIEEIIVIIPGGVMRRNNTVRVDRLDIKDLNAIESANLSEALANINGVQQASMGTGIAKPVIRGMQGVRVLTVLNGMRIENQQWGGDHGLGISQLGLGAVEVIKGPSSLLYGADAFGGVVYLSDARFSKQNTYELTAQSKFQSVNMGTTNSLQFKYSKNNVHFNVAGLYSDFADYQLPDGQYLQNSRYFDHGAKARLGINKGNWSMQARYMFSNSRMGIPGHTHDSIPHPDDFVVDVQSRVLNIPAQHILNHFAALENRFHMNGHELYLMVGHTFNKLSEYEEKFTIPALSLGLNNSLYHLKFTAKAGERLKITSGIQGMYQTNRNVKGLEEQLIPDYDQLDNGVYTLAHWDIKEGFSVQGGGRFDMRSLSSDSLDKSYLSPNFSIGILKAWSHEKGRSSLRFNVSSGFRAPHVSELLVDGEHHGALRYEIGDSDLKYERATQFDLNFEYEAEHLSFVVNPFYNYIRNYIQVEASDSMIDDLPVYYYRQKDQSQLYGFDIGVHYHPHFAHWLHFESAYSLIYGEDFDGNPISLMPQPRLNTTIKMNFAERWKFNPDQVVLQHQYYFPQDRISEFETISSGYHLINVGLNFKLHTDNPLEIAIGVKNALNEEYINHLSRLKNIGVNEPGRNFYINLRYILNGKLKRK